MEFESEDIVFQFGYYTMGADMFKGTTADGKVVFWTEFYNAFDNVNDDISPEGADEPSYSIEEALTRALPGINLLLSEPIRIEPECEPAIRARVNEDLSAVTDKDRAEIGNSIPGSAEAWFARLEE